MSILGSGTVVENVGAAFFKPNRSQKTHLQLFAKRRIATPGQRNVQKWICVNNHVIIIYLGRDTCCAYAGMHVVLFPLRKFQLCANAVAPGKLRVGLKYLTNRVLARTSTRKISTRTFATRILPETVTVLRIT